MKTTTKITVSGASTIQVGTATITTTSPATLEITTSDGEPIMLDNVTTFQGLGGVDQRDVGLMEPGLYMFDHADQGVKYVRLVAGTPAAIIEGIFLPIVNSNAAAPKYWEIR